MGYNDNLVSRWDMSTINPPDLGFRRLGNDGTGVNLVTATDIVQGIHGKSMATEYNGIDEATIITGHVSLQVAASGTITLWYRITPGSGGFRRFFAWNNVYLTAYLDGGDDIITWVGGTTLNTAYAPSEGEWHMLALTCDGTNQRVYNDSVLIRTGVQGAGAAAGDFFIASQSAVGAQGFDGAIDNFRVYDAVLTNLQVTDLYVASRQGRL